MKKLTLFLTAALTALATMAQGWPANYGGVMLQGFFWDSYLEKPDCSPFGSNGNGVPANFTSQSGYTWATMYGAGWGAAPGTAVPAGLQVSLKVYVYCAVAVLVGVLPL